MLTHIDSLLLKNTQYDRRIVQMDDDYAQMKRAVGRIDDLIGRINENVLGTVEDVKRLKANKVDANEYERFTNSLDDLLLEIQVKTENNKNHFSMVENFVEKYVPSHIQSMIGETLGKCLTGDEDKRLLREFERDKFKVLHDIILNDDGFPDLYQKIKDIHISIPNFNVFQYQKLYMSN